MDTYTVTQVAQLFSVSREAVRRWAVEFKKHLSVTANPGDERQRAFTDEDLEKLALVATEKKLGKRVPEIAAMLANGQRGSAPPGISPLVLTENPRTIAMQSTINALQEKVAFLQSALDQQIGRDRLLEEKLIAAEAEIKSLNREIGRLEAGGKQQVE